MQLIHANTGRERITGVSKDCLEGINGHCFSPTFNGQFVKYSLTCCGMNASFCASEVLCSYSQGPVLLLGAKQVQLWVCPDWTSFFGHSLTSSDLQNHLFPGLLSREQGHSSQIAQKDSFKKEKCYLAVVACTFSPEMLSGWPRPGPKHIHLQ